MIRLFISALASTKLIILQGISGTGKTSLAYAWGKFLKHDSYYQSPTNFKHFEKVFFRLLLMNTYNRNSFDDKDYIL